MNYDYNNNINSVDIIYNIHNQYMIDHWIQKYEWRWELFWWIHGVIFVNTYVIYKTKHDFNNNHPTNHYELWRKIVLNKLDSQLFWGAVSSRKQIMTLRDVQAQGIKIII